MHPFLATPKYDETLEFYRDVLGFMASDYIEDVTAFLRCENRYHHTVAIQKNKEYYVAHLCFMMKSSTTSCVVGPRRSTRTCRSPPTWSTTRRRPRSRSTCTTCATARVTAVRPAPGLHAGRA
ncbi:VOC family protein [Aeromicrobium sp. UC242_57]|uniref:VOC family protein n=1 Tax=Aeromicrobium sp. UC242_57 TaxID=3374624 RepID=UPI0037AA969D